ncbi:Bifunctional hemolysin/adenylate cyclase precursor [Pelagimonas phthalicica]|uniref:Bifunctional hemolysin/adenylate cyclase n=1 Tax=Pelagimonas phthalicica TaxID=1037362 RepID=A0A238JJ29_9RHOB|nr:calcium-binding protein [Pelagimonas phthalicica]TDS88399.1 Ca2+-binding RTX toxin-like protein [Pelagimonas phthalicica]SMX30485.1 Bifunctional hemolysin/adenylate cyclase precursor [Pelagimonas phthalicica]
MIIPGTNGNDVILGEDTSDFILGYEGNDTINGGDGNDNLRGGIGADWLIGGDGFDRADYRDSTSGITIQFSPHGWATGSGGTAEGDYLQEIEAVIGSSYNDKVEGWLGGDTFFHISGNDEFFTTNGKIDFELATEASNGVGVIVNLGHSSVNAVMTTFTETHVTVLGHTNRLFMEQAVDAGASSVRMIGVVDVDGTQNSDWIAADLNDNILDGHGGNDYLFGGRGKDVIYGGDGDDSIVGGNEVDSVLGDDDTLYGENGDDTIFGGVGNDLLRGDAGYDSLDGGSGLDTLRGGDENDTLHGGTGSDRLYGDDGDDVMFGGNDLDIDYLIGGAGADTFLFSNTTGRDRILDFETGIDRIDLSDVSSLNNFSDVLAAASNTSNGHVKIDFGGGNLVYIYDASIADLNANDFVF